jgi:glucose-6-phosphate dehydrogenase assembly protein OpcA
MSTEQTSHPGLNVGALERELNALWKNLGEEDPHSGITRTCVLNLIIVADADSLDYHLDETLIEVTEKHAGRVILLTEDQTTDQASLDAWVTSRCTLPSAGSKQVCCEQITIKASGSSIRETPSAISSLTLADLPVYLWWRDDPHLDQSLFRRLAAHSDRVLIDTSLAANPETAIEKMAEYYREGGRHTPLSDLNWTRLNTWRAVLASFYDVGDYIPALAGIDRVDIKYLRPESDGVAPRALYLAAWLASRLDWQLASVESGDGTPKLTFKSADATIEMALEAIEAIGERQGQLEQVTLTASGAGGSPAGIFNVKKTADGMRLSAEVTLGSDRRLDRLMGYDHWTESQLLDHELEALGRERVFEEVVQLASDINQKLRA